MRHPTRRSLTGGVPVIVAVSLMVPTAALAQGATHTVAQDGSGDFETIAAAIEAAVDGDTILVSPGEYPQSLYIDKVITLRGDGPRDKVVLGLEPGQPPLYDLDYYMHERGPAPVYVDGVDTVIEGLSIKGQGEEWPSLWLKGGSHSVRDIATEEFIAVRGGAAVTIEESNLGEIGLAEAGESTIRGNDLRGFFASQGSTGTFEDNVVRDHPVFVDSGADFTVRGNTIQNPQGSGVEVLEPGTVGRVLDNDISADWVAVLVEFPKEVVIEGNTINGGDVGVVVLESAALVRDNDITAEREVGVYVLGDGVLVEANTIDGGRLGMHLEARWDGLPDGVVDQPPRTRIEGNTIEDATHFGIVIEGDQVDGPSISGNTICAGRQGIRIVGDPDPAIGSNEICEVDGDA